MTPDALTLAKSGSLTPPTYTAYVNGFMINPDTQQCLLIEKQRPAFQKGKWNGIGGKIEVGEHPKDAMVREFGEETDVLTYPPEWEHTLSLQGRDFVVHFYRNFVSTFPAFRQTTDEALGLFFMNSIYSDDGIPVLDNMKWILPLQFYVLAKFPITVEWIGNQ